MVKRFALWDLDHPVILTRPSHHPERLRYRVEDPLRLLTPTGHAQMNDVHRDCATRSSASEPAGAASWYFAAANGYRSVVSVLAHVGGGVEPLQLAAVALAALAYWRRAGTLAGQDRPVAPARQASFAGGLVLVAVALASPLEHVAAELLAAHMAQHLLLADVAALLLVAGLTGPVLQPLLSPRILRPLRALVHPLVALPLWAVNLYLWHVPALHEGALSSPPLHALEHACFIATGMLIWAPLFGPLPRPGWFGDAAALGYVLAVRVAGAVLANVLLFSDSVLYPAYATGQRDWEVSAPSDQAAAGGIMLAESGALTLAVLAWLLLRALRRAEQSRRLVELGRARGVAVDSGRARRAVVAGRADELRERIDQSR